MPKYLKEGRPIDLHPKYASLSKSEVEEKFRERFTIPGPTLLALQELVASLSDDY